MKISSTAGRSAKSSASIIIVGAGFGGIAMAVKLRAAGFDRITVLERSQGIGGTWWQNTYPGAEVDTPSILYSYSFMPWRWSRTHVRQRELQSYIEAVADKFDVRKNVQFGIDVQRVQWNEDQQDYTVFSAGAVWRADFVVTAVGLLSDPRFPTWPGLDSFDGPVFHTSQWEHLHDLAGKRVAVVGSGSTATQVVPALAGVASEVVMFQREPGWIVPKKGREFTAAEQEAMNSAMAQRIVRKVMLLKRERAQLGGAIWRPGTPEHSAAERAARRFINTSLAGRPDLIEAVTPKYVYAGKRPIISDEFYPSLLLDGVRLVPKSVVRVTPTGVVDSDDVEHEADALVLSTGFKAEFLSTMKVTGRNGAELHDTWGEDPRAFLGIMMPGHPNFFMMYGPNTNGGAIVSNLELQAEYVVAAIKRVVARRATSVEVRGWALEIMDDVLQKRMKGTAFEYENNYYKSGSGRITTQWPDGVLSYGALTKTLRGAVWKIDTRARFSKSGGQDDRAELESVEVES